MNGGVRAMVDAQGALVERYAYDPYGLPLIRECAGRGDMNNDTVIDTGADQTRFNAALYPGPSIDDPRADVNGDGNRDSSDVSPWNAKEAIWDELTPTVAQAFSDVDNPFMFQGVPHFAIDTATTDTVAKLPLNHHRARFADPTTGRWVTRDSLEYNVSMIQVRISKSSWAITSISFSHDASSPRQDFYQINDSNSVTSVDPLGLLPTGPDPTDICRSTGHPAGNLAGEVVCDGNGGFVICLNECMNGMPGPVCTVAVRPSQIPLLDNCGPPVYGPEPPQGSCGWLPWCATLASRCTCKAEQTHINNFMEHARWACAGKPAGGIPQPGFHPSDNCYRLWSELEASKANLRCLQQSAAANCNTEYQNNITNAIATWQQILTLQCGAGWHP